MVKDARKPSGRDGGAGLEKGRPAARRARTPGKARGRAPARLPTAGTRYPHALQPGSDQLPLCSFPEPAQVPSASRWPHRYLAFRADTRALPWGPRSRSVRLGFVNFNTIPSWLQRPAVPEPSPNPASLPKTRPLHGPLGHQTTHPGPISWGSEAPIPQGLSELCFSWPRPSAHPVRRAHPPTFSSSHQDCTHS